MSWKIGMFGYKDPESAVYYLTLHPWSDYMSSTWNMSVPASMGAV